MINLKFRGNGSPISSCGIYKNATLLTYKLLEERNTIGEYYENET